MRFGRQRWRGGASPLRLHDDGVDHHNHDAREAGLRENDDGSQSGSRHDVAVREVKLCRPASVARQCAFPDK